MSRFGKKGEEDFSFAFLIIIFIVIILGAIAYFVLNPVINLGRENTAVFKCKNLNIVPLDCAYNQTYTFSRFSLDPNGVEIVNLTMIYEKEIGKEKTRSIISSNFNNLEYTSFLFNDSENTVNPPKTFSIMPFVKVNQDIYACEQSVKIDCVVLSNNVVFANNSVNLDSNVNSNLNSISENEQNDDIRLKNPKQIDDTNTCSNTCSKSICTAELDGYKTCGNYDSDSCSEFSSSVLCPAGEKCNPTNVSCEHVNTKPIVNIGNPGQDDVFGSNNGGPVSIDIYAYDSDGMISSIETTLLLTHITSLDEEQVTFTHLCNSNPNNQTVLLHCDWSWDQGYMNHYGLINVTVTDNSGLKEYASVNIGFYDEI